MIMSQAVKSDEAIHVIACSGSKVNFNSHMYFVLRYIYEL